MPVSVRETIEQELEHLHHRTNVEEKSLELAVKKIANNKKYIGTKSQKLEAIKKVGDEMVIGFIRHRRRMRVVDDIKLLTKLPLLHRAKTSMQDIALVVFYLGEILHFFFLEVRITRTISDLGDPFRDAYATVMNAIREENEANNKNSLVKLPPQELNSYVNESEENKRLVAKNCVAAAEYELKLREYKANGNYVNTEGQNRNQKYFNVIVSRYLAPASMGMDLAFLVKVKTDIQQSKQVQGADAISDADKENIDVGNADTGKAIASILATLALEAHNTQVAVVAARKGVSAPSDQQFQETLYFQGATWNLMKDPTIDLSSLREYADTAPNIALPGGERNNWLEESAVASSSSSSNDQGSLPMGPPVAKISPVPPTTTISPSNAIAPTVLTLQSLSPFDPASGLVMKKPPPTYPAAKKKGPTHKTPKSVGLKIFNSVSVTMYGIKVRIPSASSQSDANRLMTGGIEMISDINDVDSVVSTLSFDQKSICPQNSKATPCTALVCKARNAAISRAGTPVLNVDTYLPSSPDSALGKDVAHFFSLPMAPLRDMAGYVLQTKKDANPEDLKRCC
eukprot:jgi/Psemu1/19607/gm1.19607_g